MKLNNYRSCRKNSSFESNMKRKPLQCKKNIDFEYLKVNSQPTEMSMSLKSKRGRKSSISKNIFLDKAMQQNNQLDKVNRSLGGKRGKKLARSKSKSNVEIDISLLQDNRVIEAINTIKRKKRISLLGENNIESSRSVQNESYKANKSNRKKGKMSPLYGIPVVDNCMSQVNQSTTAINSLENKKGKKSLVLENPVTDESILRTNQSATQNNSLKNKKRKQSSVQKKGIIDKSILQANQLSIAKYSPRNRSSFAISPLKRNKRRMSLLGENNIESGRYIQNESNKANKSNRKNKKKSPLYGKPVIDNCMSQVNQSTTAINSLENEKGEKSLVLENSVTDESIPQSNQSIKRNNSLQNKKRKQSSVQKNDIIEKSISQANQLSIAKYSPRNRSSLLMNETDIDSILGKSPKETQSDKNKKHKFSDILPVTSTPIVQCHVKLQRCFILDTGTFNQKSKRPKLSEIQPNKVLPFKSPNKIKRSSTFSVNLRSRQQSMPLEETQSNTETVQNKRHFRKSPKRSKQKSKTDRKAKTFTKEITIDDLALSENPVIKRKARSEGFKCPNRNSLKHKRLMFNDLIQANENYEDDIYEAQKFDFFKDVLEETTESPNMSFSMSTPKLGFHITPKICKSTPIFKDCISPTEYALNRKIAEECFYRSKKRKHEASQESPDVPQKKKLEFSQVLVNVEKKQKDIERVLSQSTDNENSYFSDF